MVDIFVLLQQLAWYYIFSILFCMIFLIFHPILYDFFTLFINSNLVQLFGLDVIFLFVLLLLNIFIVVSNILVLFRGIAFLVWILLHTSCCN